MHGDDLTRAELNDKTSRIIKVALKVHTALGPGLLESPYQQCVAHELRKNGFTVVEQQSIPLVYEELRVEVAYRAALIVDGAVVVELKSVNALIERHEAQLQTHLNLGAFRVGLLFNFHEVHLKDGIRRRVNGF